MKIEVLPTKTEMAAAAADRAAAALRAAVEARGRAHVVAATGASQFEFLDALVHRPGVDWARTVFFHLDEYVGLPATHPASFRRYLRERIVERVHPGTFHFIDGDAPDTQAEDRKSTRLNSSHLGISYAVFCWKKKKQSRTLLVRVTVHTNAHLTTTKTAAS